MAIPLGKKIKPSKEQMSLDTEAPVIDYTKPLDKKTEKATLAELAKKRKDYLTDLESKRQNYSRAQEFDKIVADQEAKSLKFASEQERADYLKEMEKNRTEMYQAEADAKKAQEDAKVQAERAQEFEALQADRDAQTKAFAEQINRPIDEFFTKFMETNPTVDQARVASEMRTKLDNGESPANIMRSTLLSRPQKELIIKDYQDSVTQRQATTEPTIPKTFEEKIAEGEKMMTETASTPPTRG